MTTSEIQNSLTDRKRAILVQAYEDMVTPELILPRHFPGKDITAAQSEIRRLCAASLLYSLPFADRKRYYRLTRHAAKLLQVHARNTRPLKRQGLTERFAYSWFFNVHQLDQAFRFSPKDWADKFPCFASRRYWRRPFYIREEPSTGEARFGIAMVDHGGSRRRSTSKTTELLAELIQCGWLDPRQGERRLTLTLLTSKEDRAESLKHLLDQHLKTHLKTQGAVELITIEVLSVPGLNSLTINTNQTEK